MIGGFRLRRGGGVADGVVVQATAFRLLGMICGWVWRSGMSFPAAILGLRCIAGMVVLLGDGPG